jgi:hypothetical protein
MFNVPNVKNESFSFVADVAINTTVIVGIIALLTGSTLLYSVSFTGLIVSLVTGSIYLLQKK